MPTDDSRALEPLDLDTARRLTGGDENLLRELAEMFPGESRRHLDGVRAGIERAEAELIRRSAHSLKSTAGLFGASALVSAARAVEQAGSADDLAGAESALDALGEEVARLEAALRRYLEA